MMNPVVLGRISKSFDNHLKTVQFTIYPNMSINLTGD